MAKRQFFLIRLIAVSLFAAVMGGSWDTWWHVAVGREGFWVPPHLILYGGVLISLLASLYAWYITRYKAWKKLSLFLILIPLAGPIDEIWHRIFGVENLASPLILWSPPHLLLIFAITFSLFALLSLIRLDENLASKTLFSNLVYTLILGILNILLIPTYPLGAYHVFGFWGAGVFSAVFIGVLLFSGLRDRSFAGATLITAFFLLIQAVAFGHKELSWIIIQPHDHSPSGLIVFSFLAAALILDLTSRSPLSTGAQQSYPTPSSKRNLSRNLFEWVFKPR